MSPFPLSLASRMMPSFFPRCLRRGTRTLLSCLIYGAVGVSTVACGGLLDVSDPTLVRDSDIANAAGANARRQNAVRYLNQEVAEQILASARLTDELVVDQPATSQYDYLDKRDSQGFETNAGTTDRYLGLWDQIYYQTSIAIPAVRAYSPDTLKDDYLAQLFGIRGYAVLQLAEDMCPGFPLNDVAADNRPVFSGPLSTDSALTLATVWLDSALAHLGDSTRFETLVRVAKGRALLDQGRYAEAAAVVTSVVTANVYLADGPANGLWSNIRPGSWSNGGFNIAIGDREGGNGMPFVSSNDPRIARVRGGVSASDTTDTLYKSTKYNSNSPITLASGIEARLIEAEAAVHANDPTWLSILNQLRASAITPALAPLTDPGTMNARIDLVYQERAFWLYLTGRRLGDLRRLIKNYGRDPETVFPTGPYSTGGSYGTATSIPFILAGQQLSNPNITRGCTTR